MLSRVLFSAVGLSSISRAPGCSGRCWPGCLQPVGLGPTLPAHHESHWPKQTFGPLLLFSITVWLVFSFLRKIYLLTALSLNPVWKSVKKKYDKKDREQCPDFPFPSSCCATENMQSSANLGQMLRDAEGSTSLISICLSQWEVRLWTIALSKTTNKC